MQIFYERLPYSSNLRLSLWHENRFTHIHREDYPIPYIHPADSSIFSLLDREKNRTAYPKIRSQMNRAGNKKAACRYRFRVCFSLYTLYTNRKFSLSAHAG